MVACAFLTGGGIGLGGGLTTSGTKGTIDHVYFPMCSVPRYFVARLAVTLAMPQNIYQSYLSRKNIEALECMAN